MRVSYTPGSWLVLAGPNSVVVLEKLPEALEGRVAELWEATLGHGSPDGLFAFLSQAGLTQVEHLGAFFLDEDRFHGIARGEVRVVDENTRDTVLEGSGALTWREERLDVNGTYRVTLAALEPAVQTLPLVVGAATVSSVVVTANEGHIAQFTSGVDEQPMAQPEEPAAVATPETPETPSEHGEPAPAFTPPVVSSFHEDPENALHDEPPEQHDDVQEARQSEEPTKEADDYFRPAPVVASVASNQDHRVDLDVDVIVGRSPDPAHGSQGAFLMRVVSPSNDISRSHLKVTQEGWNIVVTDLNSTNGTMVKPPGAKEFELLDGATVHVEVGTILDLGDGVSLRIEPAAGHSPFAPRS